MKTYITRVLVLVFLVVFGMAANSWATLTYELGSMFPNQPGISIGTSGPWLEANFTDNADGTVTLKLTAENLLSTEFVSGVFFNIAGTSLPSNLSIKEVGTSVTTIGFEENSFKADGDGYFDLKLSFDANKFVTKDSLTYTISGTGIKASSFYDLSSPTDPKGKGGGGSGPFYVAAHIQGINGDVTKSAWVTTPIPSSVWLLGSSLIGLIGFGRRKTRNYFA